MKLVGWPPAVTGLTGRLTGRVDNPGPWPVASGKGRVGVGTVMPLGTVTQSRLRGARSAKSAVRVAGHNLRTPGGPFNFRNAEMMQRTLFSILIVVCVLNPDAGESSDPMAGTGLPGVPAARPALNFKTRLCDNFEKALYYSSDF